LNAPAVGNTLAAAIATAKASTGGASKSPPTTASPEAMAPSPKRPIKSSPSGKQILRVLVVEDDAINSQILRKRLRMDKHTVVAVGNGQEAVDMLRNDWNVDAVLMDIQCVHDFAWYWTVC
jgi:PleD family two-component response regulator